MCINQKNRKIRKFSSYRAIMKKGGAFDPNASVGTRTIYREETDSIVTFKDNSYIAEYDIKAEKRDLFCKTDYRYSV